MYVVDAALVPVNTLRTDSNAFYVITSNTNQLLGELPGLNLMGLTRQDSEKYAQLKLQYAGYDHVAIRYFIDQIFEKSLGNPEVAGSLLNYVFEVPRNLRNKYRPNYS